MVYGLRFTVYGLLLLTMVGCKSLKQTVEVPVYVHDTTHSVKEVHDSTYIDRWHTEYQKGDTIYITDEVTKTVTKIKIDTAYKYVEKPVTISKTETVEVKKPLSWWQKTFMWAGVLSFVVVLAYVIWRTRGIWNKFINI